MPSAQQWAVYTTSDGLVGNSIWFIQEDQKGYLWFITPFKGATRYDGVHFQNLNTTDGLASNNIYFALSDRKGHLWFATDRGVSRYDGRDFEHFDVADGLSDSNVTFMLEDGRGHLWFATDRGVSRYDGGDFERFDIADGLPDNNVTCILQDRKDVFWFGTGKGVCKYDGKRFQPLSTADLSHRVQVMLEDRDGCLWFGAEGGLYRKGVQSLTIEGPLVEANISSIVEDGSGNLWFATRNQGVIELDPRSRNPVPQRSLMDRSILCILEDSKANLWFGTDRGISTYDGKNFQHFTEIRDISLSFVRYILEDSDENLWFGTEHGVFRYTMENVRQFTEMDGLANNTVKVIMEDEEGRLWFGTEHGASTYDGNEFESFTLRDGLVDNEVLSMLQDSRGDLWFGTASGISKNFTSINVEDFLMNTAFRSIMEDRKGDIWFATSEGVSKYDGTAFQFFPVENSLEMFIDSKNNVWIGTWNAGIYKYEGGKPLRRYTMEDGLASNYVTWILETHDGNLWFGLKGNTSQSGRETTARGGVCRYDGIRFENLSIEDGLLSDYITVALEDGEGNLWFGTDRGIMKYDSRSDDASFRFQPITKAHGLISNYVTSILSDRAGGLWFGTDKGVSKYDGENFQNISLEEYLSFGLIESVFEDSKGAMWFTTTNDGVIQYIGPAQEIRPRIHLTHIVADTISPHVDDVRVSTTTKRITFEYKGISFKTKSERMRYTCKLEGHDLNWRPSTYEKRAHYENLAPGDYRFKVKAIDEDLHHSDPPATVNVHIFRPFHLTTQFLLIVVFGGVCLLGGAGYSATQLRKQRRIAVQFQEKLRKQEEAERIQAAKMESLRQLVAGIAHEINNPIGAISSNTDVLRRALSRIKGMLTEEFPQETGEETRVMRVFDVLENTNQTTRIASEKIAKIVANLRSFVRLDEAEWQMVDVHEGIDSVVALMEPEFEHRIKVTKEYGDVPKIYCSPSGLNQVFMSLIKNASEAIEGEGEIRIRTYVEGKYVNIEIRDTGKGIPKENIDRIFDPGFTTKGVKVGVGLGLSICYQIITDEHDGHIDVSSEAGKGTTFTVALSQQHVE